MADRPTRRLTSVALSMPPAINVDQGKSRNFGVMSDNLFRMSMQVHDELDDKAKIDGWRRGMSGDLSDGLMFQPTIRGEAYTQQAIKSYWSNLEINARVRIDELAAKHRNDPTGLQEAVDTYIGQVGGPELPKEFVQQTRNYLVLTSRPYINAARKGLVDVRVAQAEAGAIMAERTAIMNIDQMSSGMFSSDPALAASSVEAVGAMRARLSSIYSSTVTDDLGNKWPVFSPQAQAKASIAMEERVAKGTLTGWFQGQRNKIGALRAIREGQVQAPIVVDGKVVGTYNPMADLPLEARQSLLSGLRSQYAGEVSLSNSLAAAADRAQRKREDAAITDLIRQAAMNPGLDVRGQAANLLDTVEDPSNALQLGKMLISRSFTGDERDSMAFSLARINAMEGKFNWRYADPAMLGPKGIADLAQINLQAQERIEGDRSFNDGDYLDVKDLIASNYDAVDFETLVNTRTKSNRHREAVRHLDRLAVAKFMTEEQGKQFDARAWYMENVAPVVQGRAQKIREARATVSDIQAKAMDRFTELTRMKVGRAQIMKDPEYKRLLEAQQDATDAVTELTQ